MRRGFGVAMTVAAALGVLMVLVAGCGAGPRASGSPTTAPADPTTAPAPAPAPAPAATVAPRVAATPGGCHVRSSGGYLLPDPACTPGAVNPGVTQADIGSTICRSGWTETVRPPESYTEPIKFRQLAAYGEPGPVSGYEEDHLIPLELGGSPTAVANLWPEPGASPNPKDHVEAAARAAVCAGRMTLAAARHAIATDWTALGRQLGITSPPATTGMTGCRPTTPTGGCYRRGEYCPQRDHGVAGTDGSGTTITCRDDNGWRWE